LPDGISLHSVQKKHYKQKKDEIREWLDVTYPAIVRLAAKEKAEIWWLDEVGVQNTSNYVKGYAPRGKTPVIPVETKHIRVNMISAITNKGKLRFHFYHGKMNQEKFRDFLLRLIRSTSQKVYAISDNLSAHRGLLLKKWVTDNPGKIKLIYLPAYAPELNPVEYLNNNLKNEVARKGYSKEKKEIKQKAMSVMRSLQCTKDRISSFFDNEHVRYAAFAKK
jgi:transposase